MMPRMDDLIESYKAAITTDQHNIYALNNIAVLLQRAGRNAEAGHYVRRAAVLAPAVPEILLSLADWFRLANSDRAAALVYRRALGRRPDFPEALNNLGVTLRVLGDRVEATKCFASAVGARPDYAEALSNLGHALQYDMRLAQAITFYRKAIAIKPDLVLAIVNLGDARLSRGEIEAALTIYRRCLAIQPEPAFHTNVIFALDFLPGAGFEEHQAERRRWRLAFASERSEAAVRGVRGDLDRRLRLGFVSADFREHSAAWIFGPVIRRLDRNWFDVVCYSGVIREDAVTLSFRDVASQWRSVVGLTPHQIARQVRADAIDILVDLSGHSGGNQLCAFARKPAPVQVSAWGHVTGTGLGAIDYLFADKIVVPDEVRPLFAERVYDLPCFITFEPPSDLPAPSVTPASRGRPVTFGCFNRVLKLDRTAIDIWAWILREVPSSRILLKDVMLDDASTRDRIAGMFSQAGVASTRIELLGRTPRPQHLAAMADVDIALDPLAHNGGVSTVEALFMGIPVVSLLGGSATTRTTAAILTACGLEDWITGDPRAYAALAIDRSRDPAALEEVRRSIRGRLERSPVGNPDRYVPAVAAAFRDIWRQQSVRSERPMKSHPC
jgi:protein O-GlcNAc transferase